MSKRDSKTKITFIRHRNKKSCVPTQIMNLRSIQLKAQSLYKYLWLTHKSTSCQFSRHGLVGFNFTEPTLPNTRLGFIKNYCAIYLNYQYISKAFITN